MRTLVLALLVCGFAVLADAAVSIQYTASFAGALTTDCQQMYNTSVAVPYDRNTQGVYHLDFVSRASWQADVGFIDAEWWGINSATIDSSDNLFATLDYFGRASARPPTVATSKIMAKGDCFSQQNLYLFTFCFLGVVG